MTLKWDFEAIIAAEPANGVVASRPKPGLTEADWDESLHPREPAGTPEGGRFAGGIHWPETFLAGLRANKRNDHLLGGLALMTEKDRFKFLVDELGLRMTPKVVDKLSSARPLYWRVGSRNELIDAIHGLDYLRFDSRGPGVTLRSTPEEAGNMATDSTDEYLRYDIPPSAGIISGEDFKAEWHAAYAEAEALLTDAQTRAAVSGDYGEVNEAEARLLLIGDASTYALLSGHNVVDNHEYGLMVFNPEGVYVESETFTASAALPPAPVLPAPVSSGAIAGQSQRTKEGRVLMQTYVSGQPSATYASDVFMRSMDDFAEYLGTEAGDLYDKTVGYLQATVQDNPLAINRSERGARGILESGSFQNAWQTGSRDSYYMNERERAEEAMGVPVVADPVEKPLYGYVTEPVGLRGASAYGDIRFVLRDEVKERTTVCLGDSFNHVINGEQAPTPALEMSGAAIGSALDGNFSVDEDGVIDYSRYGYLEAQIYGEVTLDDIDHIEIDAFGYEDIARLAMEKGIAVVR